MGVSSATPSPNAGRLDYLVNTVGVWWGEKDVPVADIERHMWDWVFDINLGAIMLKERHAVPLLQANGGGILLVSSIEVLCGDPLAQDAYGASKGAIRSLSKSIAIQFASDNICCNAILPGYLRT